MTDLIFKRNGIKNKHFFEKKKLTNTEYQSIIIK